MRFFFRSRGFKIMLFSVIAVVIISVAVAVFSSISSPFSSIFGSLISPVQRAFTAASDKFDDFKTSLGDNRSLMEQIEELKLENAELDAKLAEYEQTLQENAYYEEFLGIKDKNPEMLFQSADVTARDHTDPYKGFTINVGLLDGVALHDPVVTPQGVVGYISEVAPTYSKVTTILSPELHAGGRDNRSLDEGVVSGRADLAKNGLCTFYNLQRDCSVSIGDFIVTAGGSVFPAGLIIGKVTDIRQQTKDTSLYAVVESNVDFKNLRKVMVITYYSGQGFVAPSEEIQ